MRVFLLGFIQYGNRYDMGNSLFGKIIHYSIKYILQFVIRLECHYSLFGKTSVLNSLRKQAIIRYPVNPHPGDWPAPMCCYIINNRHSQDGNHPHQIVKIRKDCT